MPVVTELSKVAVCITPASISPHSVRGKSGSILDIDPRTVVSRHSLPGVPLLWSLNPGLWIFNRFAVGFVQDQHTGRKQPISTSYKHLPNFDRGVLHFQISTFSNFLHCTNLVFLQLITHHSYLISQKVLRWRSWYRALPLHLHSTRSP